MKFAQTNPILGAILYNFLFGISYLPLKILTARLNGNTALLIALRFAICLVLLYALKHTERIHLRSLRDMGICILPICIFQLLNGFFETTGMCFYPSGKASVILALIPLITTLLAIPFFHEKPSAGQFFFILLSFLGIFIVAGNSEDKAATVWGFFLLLMAAFMSSSLNLCIRKLGKHLTPLDITYAMSFAMFAVYGSISLITHLVSNDPIELFRPLADPVIVGCLLALSIGSSLYASALRNIVLPICPWLLHPASAASPLLQLYLQALLFLASLSVSMNFSVLLSSFWESGESMHFTIKMGDFLSLIILLYFTYISPRQTFYQ